MCISFFNLNVFNFCHCLMGTARKSAYRYIISVKTCRQHSNSNQIQILTFSYKCFLLLQDIQKSCLTGAVFPPGHCGYYSVLAQRWGQRTSIRTGVLDCSPSLPAHSCWIFPEGGPSGWRCHRLTYNLRVPCHILALPAGYHYVKGWDRLFFYGN